MEFGYRMLYKLYFEHSASRNPVEIGILNA